MSADVSDPQPRATVTPDLTHVRWYALTGQNDKLLQRSYIVMVSISAGHHPFISHILVVLLNGTHFPVRIPKTKRKLLSVKTTIFFLRVEIMWYSTVSR